MSDSKASFSASPAWKTKDGLLVVKSEKSGQGRTHRHCLEKGGFVAEEVFEYELGHRKLAPLWDEVLQEMNVKISPETTKTSPIVRVDNLPCTLYNKVCQANVILTRRLIPGRLHDFIVRVRDSAGDVNSMQATISVTNSTTPRDKIFPYVPSLIMVPENTKPEKELDYLLVESNPWSGKPVYIELWQPKELFKIRQRQMGSQTKGVITLIGDLDFETQSMYTLTMYATDPYTEPGKDTRNIAGLHIVVIVQDVQDVPPVFTLAPPLTKINNTIKPGDLILRVHAEDGDKGVPRDVTYGLISEGNPFTPFFNVSETTGEIFLARPLEELTKITHVGAPIILKIVAEEVRTMRDEPPAQATIVELGILLGEPGNSPPYFENDNYVAWMDENSESGTTVAFSETYSTLVRDEDIGKAGVFALKLENNNGTFEISPTVAERTANFVITVRDNTLIDYEKFKSLQFKIVAQEVGPATNLSASVPVTIFLRDINDNPPIFDEPVYEVTLAENSVAGTRVLQVHATDNDVGYFGRIQYVRIIGEGSEAFDLNEDDGLITVSMSSILDREQTSKMELIVEARDEEGRGLRGNTTLIVNILDINDNAPVFEKAAYEFLLDPEQKNFTMPAFIKAFDADAEPPNNIIRYEIVHGNYDNKFKLNEDTGELTLVEPIDNERRVRRTVNLKRRIRSLGKLNQKNQSNEIEIIDQTQGFKFQDPRALEDYTQSESDSSDLNRKRRAETDPLFILTARAYDLGVPHLSSTTQIRIMRSIPALTRTVMFVMPGENPDPTKTAETLETITGSRVTIQEIKPYLQIDTDNSADSTRRSVVVARVEQSGPGTLVDVEKIRESLAANRFEVISGMDSLAGESSGIPSIGSNPRPSDSGRSASKNITAIGFENGDAAVYKAENKLLIWLLILLALLVLAAIITLISCCICPSCPFYMEPRKRRIHSSETLIFRSDGRPKKHLYRKPVKMIDGHFSHYYSERKEAWSADPAHQHWQFNRRNKDQGISSLPGDVTSAQHRNNQLRLDRERRAASLRAGERSMYMEDVEAQNRNFCELDSLKRHELERGSDAPVRNDDAAVANDLRNDRRESVREQHFYRDGNAEVLMLVTRGEMEDHNDLTNHAANLYHANGKDILLQRFIEDQKLRRDHDIRDSLQGSHHDEDVDRSMESHQRAQETREILILPEKLEMQRQPIYIQKQRPENSMHADTRISIPDQLYKPAQPTTDSSDIYAQEDSRIFVKDLHRIAEDSSNGAAVGANLEIRKSGELRHVELVRQNALLTKLLLEREGKASNIPAVDSSSLLETQSLPGLVAIATQTDSTTATQTEFILRSRSDNEELEDEYGLRYKTKYKGKFETKSDIRKMKTIWVSTPIPEENRTLAGQKNTPTRTKIEVMESKKISISPDYLKDTSTSPKSNDSCDSAIERKVLVKQFATKSNKIRACLGDNSKNKNNTRIKAKMEKANEESTTSSPDTREKNSKAEIRKKIEKPHRLKKPERSTIQESISYMEPSFRVLEREISNFQRRIRKLGSEKLSSAEKKELAASKGESESNSNSKDSPNKSRVVVKTHKKADTKRSNPTKINVKQMVNSSGEDSSRKKVNSQQYKEYIDSDLEDENLENEPYSLDQNNAKPVFNSVPRNRAELKKQSALQNSDPKSDDEKVDESSHSEFKTRRSRINLPPIPRKTGSNPNSSKESDENNVMVQENSPSQNEDPERKPDTESNIAGACEQGKQQLAKSVGGALMKTAKRKARSLPLTGDESKLTSPLKSDDGRKFSSQRRSLNNEAIPIDLEKFMKDVKGAVEREISSLTRAARDAFTFQKSGYSVIGPSSEKSEYLLSPKTKQGNGQDQSREGKEENSDSRSILKENGRRKPTENQENGRSLVKRKSKTGSKEGNSLEESDDAISFIVIEKNETALGASDHGKIFQEENELSKSRRHENGASFRKNSNGNGLNTTSESKAGNVSLETGNAELRNLNEIAETAITTKNNTKEVNEFPSSEIDLTAAAISENLHADSKTVYDLNGDESNHSQDIALSEIPQQGLLPKVEDRIQTTSSDEVLATQMDTSQGLDGVGEESSLSYAQRDNLPSDQISPGNHPQHINIRGEDANIGLQNQSSHGNQSPSSQTASEKTKTEDHCDIVSSVTQSQSIDDPKNTILLQDDEGHILLPRTEIIDETGETTKTDMTATEPHLEYEALHNTENPTSYVTNDQMLQTEKDASEKKGSPPESSTITHESLNQKSPTTGFNSIKNFGEATENPEIFMTNNEVLTMENDAEKNHRASLEPSIPPQGSMDQILPTPDFHNIKSDEETRIQTKNATVINNLELDVTSPPSVKELPQSCPVLDIMNETEESSPKNDNFESPPVTQDTTSGPSGIEITDIPEDPVTEVSTNHNEGRIESSSDSSNVSNKKALHVPSEAPQQQSSSIRANNNISSIPRLKMVGVIAKPDGKTRQKWNTQVDRDPISKIETQRREETIRTHFQTKNRLPPMVQPSTTTDKVESKFMEGEKLQINYDETNSSRFIKSSDSKISKITTSKVSHEGQPSSHRPVVVAVRRKETQQTDPSPRPSHESYQTSDRFTELDDHSTTEQRKVEIRSKHLKLHVSHQYRRSRDELTENKSCQGNYNEDENQSKPATDQHRKDPEVANARSRYMAWYQQKRAEMEQKRREKKEAEELLFRPKGCRGSLNGSKIRKAKSAPDESGPVNLGNQSPGRRERTKSSSAEEASARINRLHVKPLVNVESEQLKAIVRQGRKLRRAEGVREEDPPVQIFAPAERPSLAIIAQPDTRHHLTQHSEYKFEKAVTAALPFYLHPPPVPHPSPEHCQDDSSDSRRIDDDLDSGIAVSLQGGNRLRHQQLLEKKTVFDIAYIEASPSHLRSDSSTPPS